MRLRRAAKASVLCHPERKRRISCPCQAAMRSFATLRTTGFPLAGQDTTETLRDKVARLACWKSPVELTPLKGGLTNISFVVTHGGEKFVARCGEDIPVHHVFRDRERAASMAAFEAGLSPEIIYAESGITVLRFIDGRTF